MKIIIIFMIVSKVMETLQTKEHEYTVKVLTTSSIVILDFIFTSYCPAGARSAPAGPKG